MYSQILTQKPPQSLSLERDLSFKIQSFKNCICRKKYCSNCTKNRKLSRELNSKLKTISSDNIDSIASYLCKYKTQLRSILSIGNFYIAGEFDGAMNYYKNKDKMPDWYQKVTYETHCEFRNLCLRRFLHYSYGNSNNITTAQIDSTLKKLSLYTSPKLLTYIFEELKSNYGIAYSRNDFEVVNYYISKATEKYNRIYSKKFEHLYKKLQIKRSLENHISEVCLIYQIYEYLGYQPFKL